MTRIRKQNIDRYHRILSQGIFEWPELEVGKMLYRYFLQYGIQHLLFLGKDKTARAMLLNIPFFHALLNEWPDNVEPLKIWRCLNIGHYHHKYVESLDVLQANDRESVYKVCNFLEKTGFLKSAYHLCLWLKSHVVLQHDESLLYASILNGMDRYNEAMEILQEQIHHLSTDKQKSQVYVYLALVCHNMGDVRSEEMYLERDMQNCIQMFGEDHESTLTAKYNMAIFMRNEQRYDEALELFLFIAEMRKHLYGETHPRTLSVYNSLAILYKELQRYEEAERHYIHVYKNQKMILGKHHPQTLVICNNIGVLYKTQGQIEKAREYLLESMEGFTFLYGEGHSQVLQIKSIIADTYLQEKEYVLAENILQGVITKQESILGNKHPDLLVTLARLSRLYKHKGDFEQAEPLYIRVLELRIEVFGLSHYKTLIAKRNLGVLYFSFEHYPKAEVIFLELYNYYKSEFGLFHKSFASICEDLREFFSEQKDYERAILYGKEEVNALDKIYGEHHKRTTSTRYQLAVFLRKQSKYTDSLQLFLQVLESEKVIYGENDTSLAMTYWNIALCYRKLEQYQQASEYCYLCWQLECKETENCDPDVLYTFQILCSDLLKSNQYQMIIDLIVPIKEELLHGSKNRSNEQKKYLSYFVELEKQVSAFIV